MYWKYAGLLVLIILVEVNTKALKGKRPVESKGNASKKLKGIKTSSHEVHVIDTKSSRSKVSDSKLQELIKDPEKLDSDEMQQVKMLDFYNSKFMNSGLASESQMLIDQGIDADSARKIASMDNVPGITRHRSSHGMMENGVSKDTFSSKLGMDISRWPEYHIRDSAGYNIATTTDNKPSPQYISSSITDDEREVDEGNNSNMGMGMGQGDSEMSMQQGEYKGSPEQDSMMGNDHDQGMMANMYNGGKPESQPSMAMFDADKMGQAHVGHTQMGQAQMGQAQMGQAQMDHGQMGHGQMANMYDSDKQMSQPQMHGGFNHMSMGLKGNYVDHGHVRSKAHRHHK